MKRRWQFLVIAAIVPLLSAQDCSNKSQRASSGAAQVTDFFEVPLNSRGNTVEQQNIMDRLRVTTDPTKVLWIHLIGLDGTIIRRMPVRAKVTSSGKRLEPVTAANRNESYPEAGNGRETTEFIQADGTYGSSDNYIYWFDPMGRYHQYGTAGGIGYLITDYPIDLVDPTDELTGMYRMHAAAYEWQQQQEEQLRQEEGA